MNYGSSLKLSVMQYATYTNEPFFASTGMGDMLKGMVHSFKFHVNIPTITVLVHSFLLNCFDEGTEKVLPRFMFNSFKFPEI